MRLVAASKKLIQFDPKTFLSTINGGRKIEAFAKKQTIFAQGDPSDAVFYIKEGKVKLTVRGGEPASAERYCMRLKCVCNILIIN